MTAPSPATNARSAGIDLERGDLRVRRQVSRINGEVVEAPLKTKNAYRTLPLA